MRLIMNLTFFWRAWKLDFWPVLGVYPPLLGVYPSSLALADYWSHLVLGFTPLAGVYPRSLRPPGVYPPNGLPPTSRGKEVNPATRLIMNLTFFWRAWKLDFCPVLGVYPPLLGVYPSSLALADYWSHLVLGFTPLGGVYPRSLRLGLTTRGLPPK